MMKRTLILISLLFTLLLASTGWAAEDWGAFDVKITPQGTVAAGQSVTFTVEITNTTASAFSPKIYHWYYRENDNSETYPGVEFGTMSGEGLIRRNADGDDGGDEELSVNLVAGHKVTLSLSGTLPSTWNAKSAITIVVSASEDNCMGQGEYLGSAASQEPKETPESNAPQETEDDSSKNQNTDTNAASGQSTGTQQETEKPQASTEQQKAAETEQPAAQQPASEQTSPAKLKLEKTVKGESYSVTLAKTQVTANGKEQKPKLTVKVGGKKVAAKNLSVKYSRNVKPGLATVKVQGKGKYASKVPATKLFFIILPQKPAVTTVKAKKAGLSVSWSLEKGVTGYEVQVAANKKFTDGTTYRLPGSAKKETVGELEAKKKYYVRVRAYIEVEETIFYGKWSPAKKVKTK